jgi:hypothetical protein
MKKVEWKWIEIQKLFNEINVCVISEDAFRQRFAASGSGVICSLTTTNIPNI